MPGERKNMHIKSEARRGYEIITRKNATDAVPKDGEWEELTDGQEPGWKDTWRPFSNTNGRTFRQFFTDYPFLIALRRPLTDPARAEAREIARKLVKRWTQRFNLTHAKGRRIEIGRCLIQLETAFNLNKPPLPRRGNRL